MSKPAKPAHAETSAIDPRAFRTAAGRFPTGVTIVTCRSPDGEDIGMTMNSFSSVSLDPPLVLFSVDRRAYSMPAWEQAQAYGINVLAEGQNELSNRFAKPLEDKWQGVPVSRGIGDVPLLDGAIAQFECLPYARYDGGDHIIFVARVERFGLPSNADPLVFSQGRYNHLRAGPKAPPDWPLPIHY
jgi:flavin reductase (DIM6/NTAB) family NADH-FMN oxidoreductase RutF